MKPITIRLGGALALVIAAAGCVPKPMPPVQDRPAPVPSPAPSPPPAVGNWIDAPQTTGDWRYAAEQLTTGRYSSAEFRAPSGEMLFRIMCAAGNNVLLSRSVATFENKSLTVRTETAVRSLVAPPDPEGQQIVTAVVRPSDRLLDAMALSKGRFAVEVAGSEPLYLPSWAEVTRVIEDCR